MGRIVKIDTGYQTVSVAQDLLEVLLAAGQCAVLHRVKVMQSSDESSSEAELLQVNVSRASGSYTSGSGGSTATVTKYSSSSQADDGLSAAERNNTTQASAGSGAIDNLEPGAFNVLAGEWEFCPVPEMRPAFAAAQAVVVSLDEAPADALTLRAIVWLELVSG